MDVCQTLSLPKTTVNTIWKKREMFKRQYKSSEKCGDAKCSHTSTTKDADAALLEWFKQTRSNNIVINGPLLLAKANLLASAMGDTMFKAITGFIDRWRTRHGIGFKVYGEEEAVSPADTEMWLDITPPELLDKFPPENIFNGGKKAKDRLTVLVGASMMGEKLPLVVGKSKSPQCFKGIRSVPLNSFPNTKAWMTGDLFEDIVKKWN